MEVKRRTARNLVAKLSSVFEQTRTEALCELHLISKHDHESRPLIADVGAVSYLSETLYGSSPTIQENDASTLLISPLLRALLSCPLAASSTRYLTLSIIHLLLSLNRASLVGLGAVPALVALIVRDARTGIVEDATTVLSQIARCEESEEAMRKAGRIRVLGDLLDEGTGTSERTRKNAVTALLNLARCSGEKERKEISDMEELNL